MIEILFFNKILNNENGIKSQSNLFRNFMIILAKATRNLICLF